MGIQERKAREKEAMRTLILEGARTVFLQHGFKAASIRKIADRIEYSPGTIYLYFKNKDEIFYALHVQAFNLFYTYLNEYQHVESPLERLEKMGHSYLRFAREHPELYDLMFIQEAPMNADEAQESWDCGMKAYGLLRNTVQACLTQGYFAAADLETTTFSIWAMTHGIASLFLRKRLDMFPEEELDHLVHASLHHMVSLHQKKGG